MTRGSPSRQSGARHRAQALERRDAAHEQVMNVGSSSAPSTRADRSGRGRSSGSASRTDAIAAGATERTARPRRVCPRVRDRAEHRGVEQIGEPARRHEQIEQRDRGRDAARSHAGQARRVRTDLHRLHDAVQHDRQDELRRPKRRAMRPPRRSRDRRRLRSRHRIAASSSGPEHAEAEVLRREQFAARAHATCSGRPRRSSLRSPRPSFAGPARTRCARAGSCGSTCSRATASGCP